MAHLLEHMDFIETTNGRQIKDEITAHATRLERHHHFATAPITSRPFARPTKT